MAFCRQWFMVLLLLILGSAPVFAAPSHEEKAYAAAVAAFHDQIYSQAEVELAQFVEKYGKSSHVPDVVLLEAQAQFKQGKYTEAITTLTTPPVDPGVLADQYAYWLGEAQYARGDFDHAAATFVQLANNFTNSALRLTAVVEAATAYAQVDDWPQLEQLLEQTNGVFAAKAVSDGDNELVARGRLLLAQAQFAQKNLNGARTTLKLVNAQTLSAALGWQRASLECRVLLVMNDLNGALDMTTNLMGLATQQKSDAPVRLADSVALRATILERMGQWSEAATNWQQNLAAGVPEDRQREAILKMAADATAQNNFTNAEARLSDFLIQFSNSPVASLAMLTQGELNLKQYVADSSQTNYLNLALQNFNQLLATNSAATDLVGRAFLDRGWCYWLTGYNQQALADFQAASARLPFSVDLAVAKFKEGDALFALTNYPAARTNYQAVLDGFGNLPDVRQSLGDRALYQIVRASVKLQDSAGAEKAMQQLLNDFPNSDIQDHAELLLGEGLSEFDTPTNAVEVFRDFIKRFPNSPLRPQAELDVARSFERGDNWSEAIGNYKNWLSQFSTNQLRPQVEYALAWAEYQSGNETNALARFSDFVAQHPTNSLAPLAQWWLADYYFRLGGNNYSEAEKNYEDIFQNTNVVWQQSDLFYPAQLMAGRAAFGRQGYSDAARYFSTMTADTNCPPDVALKARFAYGSVLMQWKPSDTNLPLANFELAANVFSKLGTANAGNKYGALANSELGDCEFQLGAYEAATNAYMQVMNSPHADVGLRCRAQFGLGRVLETMADTAPPKASKQLQDQALKNYLDVFQTSIGKGLNDRESPEATWVKKAGLQILSLLSANGNYPANFFDRMEWLLPQLKESLEKKRAALEAGSN